MLRQTAEDVARQLLGGCERALGREVTVHGPQIAGVYRRALEIDPTLPIEEELKRLDEGGQLVHVFADHCASVCAVVVAAADEALDAAAAAGDKKAEKKKAEAEAKSTEKQAKLDLKKLAAQQKKAAKKKSDEPAAATSDATGSAAIDESGEGGSDKPAE